MMMDPIVMMDPLHPINKAFALVAHQERELDGAGILNHSIEANAFLSKVSPS